MTNSRWSDMARPLAACIMLLATSCRDDAVAKGHGADPPLLTAASVSAVVAAVRASGSASIAGSAVPAPSSPLAKDGECKGPQPGPLPELEQRTLAAQKKGQYRFELKYPVFHEANDKTTQKLNGQLLRELTQLQKRFVDEALRFDTEGDPDNARWFEGKCDTAYHSASFASVACDTMEGPGAHPNLDKFAYNFQICPEVRVLALADLCRSVPDCRKRIIDLINEDFRTGEKKQTGIQFRDGPLGSRGESSDPEHPVAALHTFGITPTGLRFFLFDELPHVLQAFAVVDLPASKLRSVLRDDVALRIWGS